MLSCCRPATATRRHEDDGKLDLTARHVAELCCLICDSVEAGIEEIRKHHVANNPKASGRGTHRHAGDQLFTYRSITHSVAAELFVKSSRIAQNTGTHILTEQDHATVALHFFPQRIIDCLNCPLAGHCSFVLCEHMLECQIGRGPGRVLGFLDGILKHFQNFCFNVLQLRM